MDDAVSAADSSAAAHSQVPASAPSPVTLDLIGRCVASLGDIVVITEAQPFDIPGPRIVYVNEAFQRQTGYASAEVIGQTPRLLQGPKTDRAELDRVGAALRRWEVVRTELINYTKDGREFHVEMDIVPIADDAGWYTHWIAVQRNVTARKLAEGQARLRELQRVESLGTLAAGIAHDFNNIVATILGNVAIARQDIADGQTALASIEQIGTAALRAREVIQRILAYSRKTPQALVRKLLCPIVQESTDLLRSALPAGVELRVTLSEEALEVLADATQLHQVLLNLGTNAWHAMQGARGSIDVDCRRFTPQDADLLGLARAQCPAERCALIRFSDDGCGMDAATAARIFEPYFTTKAVGQGTGLGLFAAFGIVEAHRGSIMVRSALGRGSNFYLVLPLLDDAATPRAADLPLAALQAGGGERVMVVDDDEMVLLMLGTLLSRAGFRVTSFNDPVAALQTLTQSSFDFDIVVTDHTMPVLSGLQLAREVAARCPALPVVIASGYLDDTLRADAQGAGAAAVVGKEFAAGELCGLLRSLVRQGATPRAVTVTAQPG